MISSVFVGLDGALASRTRDGSRRAMANVVAFAAYMVGVHSSKRIPLRREGADWDQVAEKVANGTAEAVRVRYRREVGRICRELGQPV